MIPSPRLIGGRYELHGEIASGGMATVYLGRMHGPRGFSRVVALKKLHPHLAKDERVVAALWDEARMAARINHPNVVATIEVLEDADDVFLVLEHVHGVSLSTMAKALRAQAEPMPPKIASALIAGVLAGLHAAHEVLGANGLPLGLVHRDISPQNILVGVDGLPRVIDFGIAKAAGRSQQTETGQLKGKLSYMAPEQLRNKVDRRSDLFAVGIVLWELLTSRRLFDLDEPAAITRAIEHAVIEPPSRFNSAVSPELDVVACRALERDPKERWSTARAMAVALEQAEPGATTATVAAFLAALMPEHLRARACVLADVQSDRQAAAAAETASEAHTETVRGAASSPAVPVSRNPRWARAYFGAAALVVLVAGVFMARPRPRETKPSPIVTMPAPNQVHVEPIEEVAEEPSARVSVSAPVLGPAKPKPRPRVAKRFREPPKAKPADCDPPYWLDASGVRKPKVECL